VSKTRPNLLDADAASWSNSAGELAGTLGTRLLMMPVSVVPATVES
jgi:hypothetical protein